MLRHLNYLEPDNSVIHIKQPLRYLGNELPPDVGFVYMLVSVKQPKLAYVGQTISIRRRLLEHNSGHGSTQTHAGRPWLPAVLIMGFGSREDHGSDWEEVNKINREEFEKAWRDENSDRLRTAWNSVQMIRNGERIFRQFKKRKDGSGRLLFPDLKWRALLQLRENGEFLSFENEIIFLSLGITVVALYSSNLPNAVL